MAPKHGKGRLKAPAVPLSTFSSHQLCVRSNAKGRYSTSTGTALLAVHPRTAHFLFLVSLGEGQLRLAAVGSLRLPTPQIGSHSDVNIFANPRPPNLLLRLYNIITPAVLSLFSISLPSLSSPPFLASCFLVPFVP